MSKTTYGSEVRNHAIIASVLAIAAAGLESARRALPTYSIWLEIATTLMIGILVFSVVYLIGRRLEKIERAQPIRLARIGIIDGYWIDVVWKAEDHVRKLIGASMFSVKSTDGEKFLINGSFYSIARNNNDHDFSLISDGEWSGTGYTYGDQGFVYDFKGGEGASAHHGVGYYDFYPHPADERDIIFKGAFLADVMNTKREVNGRKIRDGEVDAFRKDMGISLLKAFTALWPAER